MNKNDFFKFITQFDEKQIDYIIKSILLNPDLQNEHKELLINPKFNVQQMKQIQYAIDSGISVEDICTYIADPSFDWIKMKHLINLLKYGLYDKVELFINLSSFEIESILRFNFNRVRDEENMTYWLEYRKIIEETQDVQTLNILLSEMYYKTWVRGKKQEAQKGIQKCIKSQNSYIRKKALNALKEWKVKHKITKIDYKFIKNNDIVCGIIVSVDSNIEYKELDNDLIEVLKNVEEITYYELVCIKPIQTRIAKIIKPDNEKETIPQIDSEHIPETLYSTGLYEDSQYLNSLFKEFGY